MIWTDVHSYDAFLAEYRPPGWRDCPKELVIFAESHGGEGWMWDTRAKTTDDEYPIVNTEFYMMEPTYPNRLDCAQYAPTFPVFLFLCILEEACSIETACNTLGFEAIQKIRTACAALLIVSDTALVKEVRGVIAHFARVKPTDEFIGINLDCDLGRDLRLRVAGVGFGKRI